MQEEGLARPDAGHDERGDVPVTAVLAQDGQGVPEREVGFVGPGEPEVGGGQGPTGDRDRLGRLTGQGGRLAHGRRRHDVVAQETPERAVDGEQPSLRHRFRCDPLPDTVEGPMHEVGVEVVEGRRHRRRRDGAHRRRAAGEVPGP